MLWLPAEFITVKRAALTDSAADLICLVSGEQTCVDAESQTCLHNWKGKRVKQACQVTQFAI